MRALLITLLLVAFKSSIAAIDMSNNCRADLQLLQNELIRNNFQITKKITQSYPIYNLDGTYYLSLLATVNSDFDKNEYLSKNIWVGSQIGSIITLKYPINQLANLENLQGIDQLKIAGKMQPLLDKVRYDTRVDSVHAGYGLPSSYTGKDVLIGVTDWGFDYSHPTFYDTLLEETRILAAWDQFNTSGPHPVGFAYGTEYNTPESLIAAGSDTANIYSYGTHGTHVGGIAGGSGAGTSYRGIAFESQFLFTTFLVDEAAVLDAWQWMYNKSVSEEKRLVINMSWGLYFMGALDGTSLLSQSLDSYADLGVVFVTSAGNNGGVDFHLKKEFDTDTLLSKIQFYEDPESAVLWGQSIHGWGEAEHSFKAGIKVLNGSNELMIESPWYATETTDTYIDTFLVVPGTSDSIFYNLSMDASYPTNNRPQMRLRVKNYDFTYKIMLKSTAENGTIHFWNVTELTTDVGNWGMAFQSIGAGYAAGDHFYGIGTPACSKEAISVAAYSASYETGSGVVLGGGGAYFSSIGPLIDESLKPDIAAPGVSVASSISSYTDVGYTEVTSVDFEGRTYPFAKFSGTSMSSPAVTGIVALMLEANPYLSAWQVKQIIIQTAREDTYTGVIPETGDAKWGWGKINAYAAVKRAVNTVGLMESTQIPEPVWTIYPNPANTFVSITNLPAGASIEIIDLAGNFCGTYINTSQIDIQHLPAGVYILRVIVDQKVQQKKFIVS